MVENDLVPFHNLEIWIWMILIRLWGDTHSLGLEGQEDLNQ